jgi:hypothetical protein
LYVKLGCVYATAGPTSGLLGLAVPVVKLLGFSWAIVECLRQD